MRLSAPERAPMRLEHALSAQVEAPVQDDLQMTL